MHDLADIKHGIEDDWVTGGVLLPQEKGISDGLAGIHLERVPLKEVHKGQELVHGKHIAEVVHVSEDLADNGEELWGGGGEGEGRGQEGEGEGMGLGRGERRGREGGREEMERGGEGEVCIHTVVMCVHTLEDLTCSSPTQIHTEHCTYTQQYHNVLTCG